MQLSGKYTIMLIGMSMLLSCNFEVKDKDRDRGDIKGLITEVSTNGTDLALQIDGYEGWFYFNRYLKTDRSIDTFKRLLAGREVRIKCFAFNSNSRPIDTLFIDSLKLF